MHVNFIRVSHSCLICGIYDLQEFSGVGGLRDDMDLETDTKKMPTRTLEIIASCHALVSMDSKLVQYIPYLIFLLLSFI